MVATNHIRARRCGDVLVVGFTRPDVIDPVYIRSAGDEMYHLVRDLDDPRVVVDFEGIRTMSSMSIAVVLGLKRVIDKRNGRLCVANVLDEIRGVFRLTRATKKLGFFADTDQAVASVR